METSYPIQEVIIEEFRDVIYGRVSKAIGSNKWEVVFDVDRRIKNAQQGC